MTTTYFDAFISYASKDTYLDFTNKKNVNVINEFKKVLEEHNHPEKRKRKFKVCTDSEDFELEETSGSEETANPNPDEHRENQVDMPENIQVPFGVPDNFWDQFEEMSYLPKPAEMGTQGSGASQQGGEASGEGEDADDESDADSDEDEAPRRHEVNMMLLDQVTGQVEPGGQR